jgi:hypothetical protein
MSAPQIIVIVLLAMRLGINAANHGQPIKPQPLLTYSFPIALLNASFWIGILCWGGFFAGGAA